MLARVSSIALRGVEGIPLQIEVDVAGGLPGIVVVGLADRAVRESRDRVRSALQNAGYEPPRRKVTVNLAPSDVPKAGTAYDLPIAVGLLAATGQVEDLAGGDVAWAGELSLDGRVRPVRGILPMAVAARRAGMRRLVVPEGNVPEALVVEGLEVVGVGTLAEAAGVAAGSPIAPRRAGGHVRPRPRGAHDDFGEVRGQALAKRALTVAASGGHNLLLVGPPGAGKSMLARCLPSILPPLSVAEALETTCIHSVAGELGEGGGLLSDRPFRDPHHTISAAALVGGGSIPRPGEISLAHNGILFLDELPEFKRATLDVLRQPMENGSVSIGRTAGRARFPSRFLLVAAMNPCSCGRLGDPRAACRCPPGDVQRYLGRLSGPLLDRIDLKLEVRPTLAADLVDGGRDPVDSNGMRSEVFAARHAQDMRAGVLNAHLPAADLLRACDLDADARRTVRDIGGAFAMSARAVHRLLKVARTVADLAGRARVLAQDVAEAAQYRLAETAAGGIG